MLAELVKALENKKVVLERELAAIHEKQAAKGPGQEELARDAGEKERLLAALNEQAIREYKTLWQSYTPANPFPCPICFVFDKKISPLKPLPRRDDVEPLHCSVCRETFEIPIELLYA